MSQNAISPKLVYLLATTTGVAVAAIYLCQPLLHTLGQVLNLSNAQTGLVMTLTQVGYALGVFFLVPLGDVLAKKPLVINKLFLLSIALIITGMSTGLAMLLIGSLAIGILASVAQDVVPLAADLAPDAIRGRVIGTVMSGLFLGILVSRTASGALADWLGWRAVFWVGGALVILIAWILRRQVPATPARGHQPYFRLLKSMVQLIGQHRALRNSVLSQGLAGFAFSAFWTNLSFHLGGPEFGLSSTQIGLFGFAGAAGASIAPVAGRLVDRRGPRTGILIGGYILVASFALMAALPHSLSILILTTVTFDLGIQMCLISHQSVIYGLNPRARSSLNAVFVAGLFVAFSLGSLISVQALARRGWLGVVHLALATSVLSLANTLRWRPPNVPMAGEDEV